MATQVSANRSILRGRLRAHNVVFWALTLAAVAVLGVNAVRF